jgi:hypothetical protein
MFPQVGLESKGIKFPGRVWLRRPSLSTTASSTATAPHSPSTFGTRSTSGSGSGSDGEADTGSSSRRPSALGRRPSIFGGLGAGVGNSGLFGLAKRKLSVQVIVGFRVLEIIKIDSLHPRFRKKQR